MEDIEEGEIASSGDEETYTPLCRPQVQKHSTEKIDSDTSDADSTETEDDSDEESGRPARKIKKISGKKRGKDADADAGGAVFKALAARYQEERARKGLPSGKRTNNVWGSILQEDTLTSELTGIGVHRTLKDLDTDRGAETYDYVLAGQVKEMEKKMEKKKAELEENRQLDSELNDYWTRKRDPSPSSGEAVGKDDRRTSAIQAGKKRSLKDRLGPVKRSGRGSGTHSPDNDAWDTMSIPPPGVARTIPDLGKAVQDLVDGMDDQDIWDSDDDMASVLGDELASKLSEPKTELMVGVVDLVGPQVSLELFEKTQELEKNGGMMIKNGARRRTPGGVFLHLLRERAADKRDTRVDADKVRQLFTQSNKPATKSRASKNQDFKSQLDAFKKMSKEKREEDDRRKEREEESDLKPLPDILTCISKQMMASSSSAFVGDDSQRQHDRPFDEPDAPPNSVERVERASTTYDDDFLSVECETEDIELF